MLNKLQNKYQIHFRGTQNQTTINTFILNKIQKQTANLFEGNPKTKQQ